MSDLKIPAGLSPINQLDPENLTFERKCGSCTACCTHLGIDELKKKTGIPCQHLDTKHFGGQHNCKTYPNRPRACKTFHCCWILGLGPEISGRPDRSGLLISMHKQEDNELGVTINVIDSRRCGNFNDKDSILGTFVQELLNTGLNDIKIVNQANQKIIYFKSGLIRYGKVFPQEAYEDLKFEVFDPPIGIYERSSSDV